MPDGTQEVGTHALRAQIETLQAQVKALEADSGGGGSGDLLSATVFPGPGIELAEGETAEIMALDEITVAGWVLIEAHLSIGNNIEESGPIEAHVIAKDEAEGFWLKREKLSVPSAAGVLQDIDIYGAIQMQVENPHTYALTLTNPAESLAEITVPGTDSGSIICMSARLIIPA